MTRLTTLTAALTLTMIAEHQPTEAADGQEIGFIERFALAEDREQALEELIPGTDDFYYFHCLHLEQQENWERQAELIADWEKRKRGSRLLREIRYRRALLRYGQDPQGSLRFIREELDLRFNHQQEKRDQRPDLPTSLDQDFVSHTSFLDDALRRSHNDPPLGERGVDFVLRNQVKLSPQQTRAVLRKVQWPDYERLVELVAADLNLRESRGFGEFAIHGRMLEAQLIELARRVPKVLGDEDYVRARILRLRPNDDTNWTFDLAEKQAYLERTWDFVQNLDAAWNSLKVHVVFHLLEVKRQQGVYDRALFLTYLQLPRQASYVEPKFLDRPQHRGRAANLGQNFIAMTALPPVGDDSELVFDHLTEFLTQDEKPDAFADYIRQNQLDDHWAETMLQAGKGDAERWYSILGPGKTQALKERVTIGLRPSNPRETAPEQAVTLVADVKNVPRLVLKIYELNALNVYQRTGAEIDTAIELDGLVPNIERAFDYEETPMLRKRRSFPLPELTGKRGVWVVELIGGGKSSRALIRKGSLQILADTTAAGHVLRVLDEDNVRVENPAVWLSGKRYAANDDGEVILPFSNEPGARSIVLEGNGIAALASFSHEAENYALTANFFVDREQLLARNEAKLLVRPSLTVNGMPAPVALLEEVELTIETATQDGVQSSERVPDFELSSEEESAYAFKVPDRLASMNFVLTAKLDRPSRGDKADLHAGDSIYVSAINQTKETRALFLTKFGENWVVELLGKNGEPIPEAALNCSFVHRDFPGFNRRTSLKTDESGRANLGRLADIEHVRVDSPNASVQTWDLPRERRTRDSVVTVQAGEAMRIPAVGDFDAPTRETVAFFGLRQDALRDDRFGSLKLENRAFVVENLDPGDYVLHLREEGRTVRIRVAEGETREGFVLGSDRHLEVAMLEPTSLVSAVVEGTNLVVKLGSPNALTRVHVIADRFFPEIDAHAQFASFPRLTPLEIRRATWRNSYVSGRKLGEEHRYILERRQSETHPGNLLGRPGLLLNPWDLRDSQTDTQQAESGEMYDKRQAGAASKMKRDAADDPAAAGVETSHPDPGFLATTSAKLENLKPDDGGLVRVPLERLGDRHWLRVVVVDPTQVLTKDVFLDDRETEFQDLRLAGALDPTKTYAQKKQTTVLSQGETLELGSTEFKIFDNFGDLHSLFSTLADDAGELLGEFAFLLTWDELEQAAKQEKYSKYASHELSFFLSRRDPDFFNAVIKPYLANKRDKTFLDDYLLGKNLERYLELYEFGRLNIVEKLLLARRLGGDVEAQIERHVIDAFALLPRDLGGEDTLFETALRNRSLGDLDGDAFGEVAGRADYAFSGGNGLGIDLQGAPAAKPAPASRKKEKALRNELAKAPRGAVLEAAVVEMEEAAEMDAEDGLQRQAGRKLGLMIQPEREQLDRLRELRDETRQLYRKLDATKVWAENNYYEVPIERQIGDYITVNAFWRDYAAWDGQGKFQSANFVHATQNFSEMMFALALIGLPAEAAEHDIRVEDGLLKITAGGNVIVYHQEIVPAEKDDDPAPLLVSQNFFDPANRYREENGERTDLFVTNEFLPGKAYGCQIVVTNPTSSRQILDLMTQIPAQSLPLAGTRLTHSQKVGVEPFSTQQFEYFFYFPAAEGQHPHYPVQLIKNERQIAASPAFVFNVVDELSDVDTESWDYLSQFGTEEQVIQFLEDNNLGNLDLARMAWRVREDRDFFVKTRDLLRSRGIYDPTLMSYGVYHNDPAAIREFLLAQQGYLEVCGLSIDSPLVVSDPVQRHRYQHLEYAPLVNARAHRLGSKRRVLNRDLYGQYDQFLRISGYTKTLDSEQHLAAAYYLLLQDRISEGLAHFGKVNADDMAENIQHAYLSCYAAFYANDAAQAREIAAQYVDYPVDKWRDRFARVVSQLEEIEGAAAQVHDDEDRDQKQDQLAGTEPTFELNVEDREIRIAYRNLEAVTVNFYEMDLEFLFSSNPFVSSESGRFSSIRPNSTQTVQLANDATEHTLALPEEYSASNVLVEVLGGGRKKSQAYYANSLDVSIAEGYGQIQVFQDSDGKPLPATYVKVYARTNDGNVQFYKDGYTDLRGKFDYTSLNTNELDRVDEFAVLVSHNDQGSVVKEISPPNR